MGLRAAELMVLLERFGDAQPVDRPHYLSLLTVARMSREARPTGAAS